MHTPLLAYLIDVRIDLHDVCNKSGSIWNGLHKIYSTLQSDDYINHMQGCFRMTAQGNIVSLQQGVTRTSCLDSSDRYVCAST
jgi:hypothetical protein